MDPYHQPNRSIKAVVQCTKTWVRGSYLLYQLQFHRELDGRFLSWAWERPVPKVTKIFGKWGNTYAVCWGKKQPHFRVTGQQMPWGTGPALLSSATSWLWGPWVHGYSVFGLFKVQTKQSPCMPCRPIQSDCKEGLYPFHQQQPEGSSRSVREPDTKWK